MWGQRGPFAPDAAKAFINVCCFPLQLISCLIDSLQLHRWQGTFTGISSVVDFLAEEVGSAHRTTADSQPPKQTLVLVPLLALISSCMQMFLPQRGKLRKEQTISFVSMERCSSVASMVMGGGVEGRPRGRGEKREGKKGKENMQAREGD